LLTMQDEKYPPKSGATAPLSGWSAWVGVVPNL
jgi:hypothetical protein